MLSLLILEDIYELGLEDSNDDFEQHDEFGGPDNIYDRLFLEIKLESARFGYWGGTYKFTFRGDEYKIFPASPNLVNINEDFEYDDLSDTPEFADDREVFEKGAVFKNNIKIADLKDPVKLGPPYDDELFYCERNNWIWTWKDFINEVLFHMASNQDEGDEEDLWEL